LWGIDPYIEPGTERFDGIDYNAFNGSIYGLRGLADLGHTAPHVAGNRESSAYTAPDGNLHLLEWAAGAWSDQDLSSAASVAAQGDPAAIATELEQVILYRTADGAVIALTRPSRMSAHRGPLRQSQPTRSMTPLWSGSVTSSTRSTGTMSTSRSTCFEPRTEPGSVSRPVIRPLYCLLRRRQAAVLCMSTRTAFTSFPAPDRMVTSWTFSKETAAGLLKTSRPRLQMVTARHRRRRPIGPPPIPVGGGATCRVSRCPRLDLASRARHIGRKEPHLGGERSSGRGQPVRCVH
jgi:hypothetical protein